MKERTGTRNRTRMYACLRMQEIHSSVRLQYVLEGGWVGVGRAGRAGESGGEMVFKEEKGGIGRGVSDRPWCEEKTLGGGGGQRTGIKDAWLKI